MSTKTGLRGNTFIQLPQKWANFFIYLFIFQLGGFGLWPLANIIQFLNRWEFMTEINIFQGKGWDE